MMCFYSYFDRRLFKSSYKLQWGLFSAGTFREINCSRKALWEIFQRHNYYSLDTNKTGQSTNIYILKMVSPTSV